MTFDGQPYYGNKPYFTVGIPNQWFEEGFFLFEGKIYKYRDDRSAAHYHVEQPGFSEEEFLAYAEQEKIEIPVAFLEAMEG